MQITNESDHKTLGSRRHRTHQYGNVSLQDIDQMHRLTGKIVLAVRRHLASGLSCGATRLSRERGREYLLLQPLRPEQHSLTGWPQVCRNREHQTGWHR